MTAMPSPAAERMRRHRQRQRKGLRCLRIELQEMEIDELIRKGLLRSETRNDRMRSSKLFISILIAL